MGNITREKHLKLYSNKAIVEGQGSYQDLATTAREYKLAGINIAAYRGLTKFDTLTKGMSELMMPKRKFRYTEIEIEQENKKWQETKELMDKAMASYVRDITKKRKDHQDNKRYEAEIEKRMNAKTNQGKEKES